MASPRTYPVCAVVLSRTKMGESDLALSLLADDGRQLRAVAKGARKPQGRLAGKVQLFSESRLLLARGRTMDVVCEATLLDAHRPTVDSLDGVEAAAAVCEVARLASFEGVEDPFLFALLRRTLAALDQSLAGAPGDRLPAAASLVVAAYTFKVLSHHGWLPETSACIECGDPHPTWFSAQAGGALCASCARDVPGAREAGASGVAWVRALVGLPFDRLIESVPDAATADWLLAQAHLWAAFHLESRLRAFEFLLGL